MALTYGFNLGPAGALYNSAQFSEAFHQLTVDHVADYSGKLEIALAGGLSFSVAPGFVFVNGRWGRLTGSNVFTLPIANATRERYDALAAVAHLDSRTVTLEVLSDVNPDSPPRTETAYAVFLYVFHLAMSQTDLTMQDVIDKREILLSYSGVAAECDRIYRYFFTAFPAEVAEIRALGQDRIDAWPDDRTALINGRKAAQEYVMGDIVQSAARPMPNSEWLACDGSAIPQAYSALATWLGSNTLPDLSASDDRLTMWIHATLDYQDRPYYGVVNWDETEPDIPYTAGASQDVDPPDEPDDPIIDPDATPTNGIETRAGEGIKTRSGEFILLRGSST